MKALVVYDSFFGNTEKIAKAIGGSLGNTQDVTVCKVNEADPGMLKGVNLMIAGSPTRAFSPTPAIKAFINKLPANSLAGIKVSAFDTRMKIDEKTPGILRFFAGIFGYADKTLLRGLLKKGGVQALPSEGFFVLGSEGPLAEGEQERAAAWGKKLGQN